MADLMKCLYQFVLENRLGGLKDSEEYRDCVLSADLRIKCVKSCLNEEQRKELSQMIDRIGFQNSVESEYIFRAALRLARELNALVGA